MGAEKLVSYVFPRLRWTSADYKQQCTPISSFYIFHKEGNLGKRKTDVIRSGRIMVHDAMPSC